MFGLIGKVLLLQLTSLIKNLHFLIIRINKIPSQMWPRIHSVRIFVSFSGTGRETGCLGLLDVHHKTFVDKRVCWMYTIKRLLTNGFVGCTP
jgi:hypothetical protein